MPPRPGMSNAPSRLPRASGMRPSRNLLVPEEHHRCISACVTVYPATGGSQSPQSDLLERPFAVVGPVRPPGSPSAAAAARGRGLSLERRFSSRS